MLKGQSIKKEARGGRGTKKEEKKDLGESRVPFNDNESVVLWLMKEALKNLGAEKRKTPGQSSKVPISPGPINQQQREDGDEANETIRLCIIFSWPSLLNISKASKPIFL